jgi:hypothetical protein
LDAESARSGTLNSTKAHRTGSCSQALTITRPPLPTTSASAAPTRPALRSRRPPARSALTRSSPTCPTATTPRSASAAPSYRPGSAR